MEPGDILIIDEPERHLHRSIVLPFLELVFKKRKKCGFIISTHDCDVPINIKKSDVLLLRYCIYGNDTIVGWKFNMANDFSKNKKIMDEAKNNILGSREKILYVEGKKRTDVKFYEKLFPETTIYNVGSYTKVTSLVKSINETYYLHRSKAYGIVDRDNKKDRKKKVNNIYIISRYSVESLYYSSLMIHHVAKNSKKINKSDEYKQQIAEAAIKNGIKAFNHGDDKNQNARSYNWDHITENNSVKKDPIKKSISDTLEFENYEDYEDEVIYLLGENDDYIKKEIIEFSGLQKLEIELSKSDESHGDHTP